MHKLETLIIGGGIAGSSLACSLAERNAANNVALVDVDLWGKFSSSELNGGGVRCTFAEPINVKLSLASTRYYLANAKKFDFRQRGYLWMYDEALWSQAKAFLPVVASFGLPIQVMDQSHLKAHYPILDNVSDLAGATFTPFDGRLSPHRLRMHYLDHAQAGGIQILDRWAVTAVEGIAPPFKIRLKRVSGRSIRKTLESTTPTSTEEITLQANNIINAAGPWAPQIARLYGRDLPITPLPRQVYLIAHPDVNLEPLPFFLDYPQDIYFRHYVVNRRPCTLVSWSDPAEQPGIRFAQRGLDYYKQHVEPRLTKRIPKLSQGEVIGSWVGHYELSPDKGAIIGPVPDRPGIHNYNALSAHGVMQSRALAESLAHFLTTNHWPEDLDLEELTESRFTRATTFKETMYV